MAEPSAFVEHDARGSGMHAHASSYAAKTRADLLRWGAECDSASCGVTRRKTHLKMSLRRKPESMGLTAHAGANEEFTRRQAIYFLATRAAGSAAGRGMSRRSLRPAPDWHGTRTPKFSNNCLGYQRLPPLEEFFFIFTINGHGAICNRYSGNRVAERIM